MIYTALEDSWMWPGAHTRPARGAISPVLGPLLWRARRATTGDLVDADWPQALGATGGEADLRVARPT